jgi:hypothetical protein
MQKLTSNLKQSSRVCLPASAVNIRIHGGHTTPTVQRLQTCRRRHSPSHRQPEHDCPCPCTCFDSEGQGRSRRWCRMTHQSFHHIRRESVTSPSKQVNLPVHHRASSFHVGRGTDPAEYREMDQLERVAVIAVAAASAASCSDRNSIEDLGHLAHVNQTLVQT